MNLPSRSVILKVVALALIAIVVGLPTATATFQHSSREVVIGAHNATVEPRFDGYATIDFGPVLPRMRVPADQPLDLGVNIDLGDSEVSNLDQLVARDAVIASQPQGEIAKVAATVGDMLLDALLRGVGAGVLAVVGVVLAWLAVGPDRRTTIWAHATSPTRNQVYAGVAVGVTVATSLVLIGAPDRPRTATDATDREWNNLTAVVPNIPTDPVLDKVEISQGAASKGGTAVVESAIATYRTSVAFYGKLAEKSGKIVVRTPLEGETTALVVTDRHDNIGMDQVARAVADQAKASMLIDLGDDTSVGGKWEAFSINSMARQFKGFDKVAVAGNHDTGPFIRKTLKSAGFTVLSGEPDTVGGIRFVGASDPRSSGLTAGYSGDESDSIAAIRRQDEALTKAACDDGDVSVLIAHSPSAVSKASASGCVDLVLTGHLHRQVGPEVVTGANGRKTVTLTTGSTGGAVYTFALGSKLRRPAQVSIVTFSDGRAVGSQSVDFEPSGQVSAQEYVPIVESDLKTSRAVSAPRSAQR
jgi:predicted phosphodiesterase